MPSKGESNHRRRRAAARGRVHSSGSPAPAAESPPRSVLDNLLEGCQIIDFAWRYVYVNDAVLRHGRRTREELLGRRMSEVYPGIEDTAMFAVLRRSMEERTSHRLENEFTFPGGSKGWFDLRIEPVPEGVFVLSVEITDRKRAEARVARLCAGSARSTSSSRARRTPSA
ncbi:MAG: PAS domain-containing protein [Planctomycetota bacterium]